MSPTELARRICGAHHPYLRTTGQQVPCGTHLQLARNLYGLIVAEGTLDFLIIAGARREAGLPVEDPEPVTAVTRSGLYGMGEDDPNVEFHETTVEGAPV